MGDDDDRRDTDRDDDRRDTDRDDDRNRDDDRGGNGGSSRERELAGEAAKYRRKLREREAELEQLKSERATEAEKATAAAVKEAVDAERVKHRRELAGLRVQLLAGAKLRDPEDAAAHLDLDDLAEHADDPAELKRAVGAAVDDLLERKPYLAREDAGDDGDGDGDRDRDRGRRGGLRDVDSRGGNRDREGAGGNRNRDDDGKDSSSWLRKAAKG